MDNAKKLSRREFREKFGTVDDKIPVPSDVKSDVSSIISDLEKEDQLPDNISYGQGVEILLERARSLKEMRDDPNIRGTLKN